MKKTIIFLGIICYTAVFYISTARPSDISDTFSEKYTSLLPPENSSVHSDYLFKQIALGSKYTIQLLDQLNERNLSLDNKADKIIEKFDLLIQQNQKIIDLLDKQMKQEN